jgi:hypothetical protein
VLVVVVRYTCGVNQQVKQVDTLANQRSDRHASVCCDPQILAAVTGPKGS